MPNAGRSDLEDFITRLGARITTLEAWVDRYARKSVREEQRRAHQELEARARQKALDPAWPTRAQLATAIPEDQISMPLLDRLKKVNSEGQGVGQIEPDDSTLMDLFHREVRNGGFLTPPPTGLDTAISNDNPLPRWDGPYIVAGAPTAVITEALGFRALQLTIPTGSAIGTELYFEQIVPAPATADRMAGDVVRVTFEHEDGPVLSDSDVDCVVALQYLDAAFVETGNATERSFSLIEGTGTSSAMCFAHAQSGESPPIDARWLRIRFGVVANAVATRNHKVYVTDVRRSRARTEYLVGELSATITSAAAGIIKQELGTLSLAPDGGSGGVLKIGNSVHGGYVLADEASLISDKWLSLKEQGSTPSAQGGQYLVYAKTDGNLYGLDDAGNEVQLNGGSSSGGSRVFSYFAG